MPRDDEVVQFVGHELPYLKILNGPIKGVIAPDSCECTDSTCHFYLSMLQCVYFMSSLSSSLFLRKSHFTFSEGLASAFDWMPIAEHYNISPSPQSADARAIASDFIVTGNDVRAALSEYGRSQ
jgi:hypothetical protein